MLMSCDLLDLCIKNNYIDLLQYVYANNIGIINLPFNTLLSIIIIIAVIIVISACGSSSFSSGGGGGLLQILALEWVCPKAIKAECWIMEHTFVATAEECAGSRGGHALRLHLRAASSASTSSGRSHLRAGDYKMPPRSCLSISFASLVGSEQWKEQPRVKIESTWTAFTARDLPPCRCRPCRPAAAPGGSWACRGSGAWRCPTPRAASVPGSTCPGSRRAAEAAAPTYQARRK